MLAAQACNIGIEPVVDPKNPALTYARLAWVQQNYIRAETLTRANVCLVNAQTRIPLAQAFGGGEVASADGLRFVVPVRTLNAGPNSKYFHVERGVTYYNFTSDQFSGFHGIVAAREALPNLRRVTASRGDCTSAHWDSQRCRAGLIHPAVFQAHKTCRTGDPRFRLA